MVDKFTIIPPLDTGFTLYRSVQYHTIESPSGDDDITPTLNTQVTSSSPPSPSCSYLPLPPLLSSLSLSSFFSQCYFLRLLPHSVYNYLAKKNMQKARLKLLKRRAMASKQQ